MKVVAYYALHYGAEYLAWSVRAIEPFVDEIRVLFTPTPSFGHGSAGMRGPETGDQLRAEVDRFLKDPSKLRWRVGTWRGEGEHRDAAEEGLRDTDTLLLHVDADEVWPAAALEALLTYVSGRRGSPRSWRVPFVHFFRSFRWLCRDPLMPERIVDLRPGRVRGEWGFCSSIAPVLHFGYAQSEAIVRYKWRVHGHKAELRPGWLDRFAGWQPGDVDMHPTNVNFWDPEPTSDEIAVHLDALLHDHPYRHLSRIP